MLKRSIEKHLQQAITQVPAVALLGARQVGKTTLAKVLGKQLDGIKTIYLDLESPGDLLKLQDAESFFEQHHDSLLILDEIQRKPDLFQILRSVIDINREKGKKSGQFLLLGSASGELLRQSSESLAGRIRYLDMYGLHALEIGANDEDCRKLWLRGGFPDSYLADNDQASMLWLEQLIRTYIERDIPRLGLKAPASKLRRLWTMLAHMQGETINISKLAGNLEWQRPVVNQYLDVLTDLLLLRRLEPWYQNVKKRLVKAPRYYIRDSGIQHQLLGIGYHNHLISNPVMGKSWEGFVIENIHAVLPARTQTYFYRTAAGAEIDLVIQWSAAETWAVEIKYGVAPKISKHYPSICDDINATHRYVVYGGNDTFSLGKGVQMISLKKLMGKIVSRV